MARQKISLAGVAAAALIALLTSSVGSVSSAVGAAGVQATTPTCDSSPEALARDEASLRETMRESLVFLFTNRRGRLDAAALARSGSSSSARGESFRRHQIRWPTSRPRGRIPVRLPQR
jgi:hypothetical protein